MNFWLSPRRRALMPRPKTAETPNAGGSCLQSILKVTSNSSSRACRERRTDCYAVTPRCAAILSSTCCLLRSSTLSKEEVQPQRAQCSRTPAELVGLNVSKRAVPAWGLPYSGTLANTVGGSLGCPLRPRTAFDDRAAADKKYRQPGLSLALDANLL